MSETLCNKFDIRHVYRMAVAISKKVKGKAVVGLGVSDYIDPENHGIPMKLGDAEIAICTTDNSRVGPDEQRLIYETINGVSRRIVDGNKANYSTDDYPVLTFGVENKNEYIGVIFVAVINYGPQPSSGEERSIVGDIELDLNDYFSSTNTDANPDNFLYTSWCYGTLFNSVIFNTNG